MSDYQVKVNKEFVDILIKEATKDWAVDLYEVSDFIQSIADRHNVEIENVLRKIIDEKSKLNEGD